MPARKDCGTEIQVTSGVLLKAGRNGGYAFSDEIIGNWAKAVRGRSKAVNAASDSRSVLVMPQGSER